ncbi:MFS transporter [Streptomyces sp. NBC_00467]|uniref:MFS transporter n=1 Tax=Streptomyces sp. NBC_00467 TaxID=2975752 RepID=UPI002E172FCF
MQKRYALWTYAAGAAAARTGDEMSGPALLLAGLAVTGSAASAASLLAGITIAAAVGGPLLGVLLDRSSRPGRLLAAALAGYAAALAVVALCLGTLPIALTVLIAAGAGLLGPALGGGWTSQLPRVVAGHGLPRANALDAMTFDAAGLLGPALAGALAHAAGARPGVVASAVLICLALPVALALPAGRRPDRPPTTTTVAADLAAGFRVIARSRPLARATATSVISCAGAGMLVACAPLLGERAFGGAGQGAFLLSGLALSALAANALLARRPDRLRADTVLVGSTVVLAAALALAATCRPVFVLTAVVLAGIGEGPQLTALFAIRHREAPERLRGQIFTTGASLKLTGFAVGAALAGPLATWSLTGALLAAAGVHVLAGAAFAGWPGAARVSRPSITPGSAAGRARSMMFGTDRASQPPTTRSLQQADESSP